MAANDSNRDAAMAAYLKRIGILHGMRRTVGLNAVPVNKAGSAAYRRRVAPR
jgi:hypothetical protein